MHRALNIEDILYEIFQQMADPRLTSTPVWWMQHEPSVFRNVAFLLALSGVSKSWSTPARRVVYRHAPLYLTTSRAEGFLRAVNSGSGEFVQGIIVDFPMSAKCPTPETAIAVLVRIFQRCPNLVRLHFDNVPPEILSSASFSELVQITSSIHEVGIRGLLSMVEWARPLASCHSFPALNISSLALSGVDLNSLIDPRHHQLFRNLRWLHLHACNARNEFLELLGAMGVEFLHVGRNLVDSSRLCQAWCKSTSLRTFTFWELRAVDSRHLLGLSDFSDLADRGITCSSTSPFPYR